jgi:hypothetical protein
MKKAKYFDKHGTEVSDDDASDGDGVLRDGFSVRVPMTMRDAMRMRDADVGATGAGEHGPIGQRPGDQCTRNGFPGTLRRGADGELFCDIGRKDALPQITDGHRPVNPAAGMRPGWRMLTVEDRSRVHAAYDRYNTSVSNAYKICDGEIQCAECFGSGQGPDGDDCDACEGSGVMPDPTNAGAGGTLFGSRNEGGEDDDPDPTSDSRKVMDQHRKTMDRAYSSYDNDLANAWRRR